MLLCNDASLNRKKYSNIYSYILLAIIIGLGLALRMYKLSEKSLWYDEVVSIFHKRSIPHIIFLKYWINLFGYTEFALRLPAVIFGVMSIYIVYKIGDILFNKEIGLMSAFLLSVSTFHVLWSQQVRYYSLLVFLSLLSSFFFILTLRNNKLKSYVAYTICGVLLCNIHPYGVFIIFVHVLFVFLLKGMREKKNKWVISQMVILLSFLILLLFFHPTAELLSYIVKPSAKVLINTIETFSFGGARLEHGGLGMDIYHKSLLIPKLLLCIFLFFLGRGIVSIMNIKRKSSVIIKNQDTGNLSYLTNNSEKLYFLLLWILIPIILPFLFSIFFRPIYLIRGTIIASVPFYILIAKGMDCIKRSLSKAVTIVIILFISVFSLNNLYNPNPKQSWRELVNYVKDNIQKDDVIILAPINQALPFMYYYHYDKEDMYQRMYSYGKEIVCYQPYSKKSPQFIYKGIKKYDREEPIKLFDIPNHITVIGIKETSDFIKEGSLLKLVKQSNNIWFIVSPDWLGNYNSDMLRDYIESRYSLKSEKRYANPGVIVYSYKINPDKKLID
jgi:hypothetical protein